MHEQFGYNELDHEEECPHRHETMTLNRPYHGFHNLQSDNLITGRLMMAFPLTSREKFGQVKWRWTIPRPHHGLAHQIGHDAMALHPGNPDELKNQFVAASDDDDDVGDDEMVVQFVNAHQNNVQSSIEVQVPVVIINDSQNNENDNQNGNVQNAVRNGNSSGNNEHLLSTSDEEEDVNEDSMSIEIISTGVYPSRVQPDHEEDDSIEIISTGVYPPNVVSENDDDDSIEIISTGVYHDKVLSENVEVENGVSGGGFLSIEEDPIGELPLSYFDICPVWEREEKQYDEEM